MRRIVTGLSDGDTIDVSILAPAGSNDAMLRLVITSETRIGPDSSLITSLEALAGQTLVDIRLPRPSAGTARSRTNDRTAAIQ